MYYLFEEWKFFFIIVKCNENIPSFLFYFIQVANAEILKELFSNITWMNYKPETLEEAHMLHHWAGPLDNVLLTTALFFIMRVSYYLLKL